MGGVPSRPNGPANPMALFPVGRMSHALAGLLDDLQRGVEGPGPPGHRHLEAVAHLREPRTGESKPSVTLSGVLRGVCLALLYLFASLVLCVFLVLVFLVLVLCLVCCFLIVCLLFVFLCLLFMFFC